MTAPRRTTLSAAAVGLTFALAVGCGVSSQDVPQPIEESAPQSVPTQTVDRKPAPASSLPIAPVHDGPSPTPSPTVP